MLRSKIKIFIFSLLLLVFFIQASPVFALEINWPSLPGATPPQEIFNQPKDEQLPLLFDYALRFFYFLSISIMIVVLIYAGLIYITSGSRPAVLAEAKNRISQVFLGFFILIGSYLILSVINPQLLVFKTRPISRPLRIIASYKNPPKELTYLQIPIGSNLQKILADLNEEKVYEKDNKKYPGAEIPVLRIADTIDEITETMETLKEQISRCRCGLSKYHISARNGKGKCVPGVKNPTEAKTDKEVCLNNCSDCGSECDIREVRRDPNSTDTIQIYDEATKKWNTITEDDKKTAIKYTRLVLTELLAKLKTQTITLSTDEIDLIAKNLGINSGELLSSDLSQISFQSDFLDQKRKLEKEGYTVKLERPKQFPETKVVHMSPASLDPFTLYAPLRGDLFDESITKGNQQAYQLSQRASLFAVLTQLSLEDIEKMIQDCLNSAFGEGNFNLNTADLARIVQQTIQQGLADFLGKVLSENAADYSSVFLNQLRQGIDEKVSSSSTKSQLVAKCENDCRANIVCLNKCKQKTIPRHFLSNKLADLMTKDIKNMMPKEVKKLVDGKIRENLLSKRLNSVLTTSTASLLDNVFQGAIKKSLKDQIPFLKENLKKSMSQIIPEIALTPLQSIDYFLLKNLKTLKKRIDNKIAEIAKKLGEEISKPATKLIEDYKKKNLGLFYDAKPPEECWEDFLGGYFYDYDLKKCVKVKLSDIQEFSKKVKDSRIGKNIQTSEDNGDWDRGGAYAYDSKSFCKACGYCWDDTIEEEDKRCHECHEWIYVGNLSLTNENLKKAGQVVLRSLVNFAEEFISALTQTLVYTLTQYTQVWVEDTIITPVQPYLSDLSDFSKKLHKFLYSSVEQVLPRQIDQYLSDNVTQILDDICAKSKQTPSGGTIQLTRGWDINVSKEAGDKACNIGQELRKSIMSRLKEDCVNDESKNKDRIGCQIGRALDDSFYDLLCKKYNPSDRKKCVLDFLNKSFAEILFPKIAGNINQIIKGTPKQLICSEINGQPYKTICPQFKDTGITAGLLPFPKKESNWSKLNENEKAYCYFIWYACEKPFASWTRTIGSIIKNIIDSSCKNKNNDFCNIVSKDSVGYTLFYYGITTNPPANEQEEIETYQWLAVTFPNLISDIDKLAKKRNLYSKWVNGPRQEAVNAYNLNGIPAYQAKGSNFAKAFVSWFAKNNTVYDVFTYPNLGVISSLDSSYRGRNILSKTPYYFVNNVICKKIELDFEKDYPNWTFSSVKNKFFPSGSAPYSMEGLNQPTIAKILSKILESSEPPFERKNAYAGCLMLKFSPAQIFGLDQSLVRYIQPKEYQIMFDLIKNELGSGERPEQLNVLLDYLYNQTPAKMLRVVGQKYSNQDLIDLSDFLQKQAGKQINKGEMSQEFIRIIFKAIGREDWLKKKIGWQDWQKIQAILAKTPSQLASLYFKKPLIDPKAKWVKRSLMGYLADPDGKANSGDETVLGERYIDTLGRALGLDQPIYNLYLKEQDFYKSVDSAIVKGKQAIQDSLDKAFLDYPKAGLGWIMGSIGKAIGTSMAGETADQFAGACRKVSSNADCKQGEAFNSKTKECCSMGAGLVCQPRCRPKPEKEDCNIEEGETLSSDGQFCCFDETCSKCRLVPEIQKDCKRDKEEKEPRVVEINDEEKKLCCKPRELKTKNGQDYCCVNIMECISDKFSFYLERMGSILRDGPALNELSE